MLAKLVAHIFLWAYALFYGSIVLFMLIKDVITKGYGKVFNKTKRERPACLQDPNLGTHGYLHLEDVRIHYVAKGPEDKPLMLFIHGFPEFWYSWRKQLLEFSKDYRCVAFDMRGYGDSDKPSGMANYALKYLLKDVQQIIEALGYKSCVLVSHDWGGAVAWAFGRLYPDYVDKLIVMNCPPSPVMQELFRSDKKQFKMSWYMFFFQLPILPEIMIASKDFFFFDRVFGDANTHKGGMKNPMASEEIEAYKYTFSQPGALTNPINFYRAALRLKRMPYDLGYTVPVLLIWAMDDMALCDKIPDMTEKECPSIVVKRIENAGHFVQNDAPEKVNEIMREWLSSPQK